MFCIILIFSLKFNFMKQNVKGDETYPYRYRLYNGNNAKVLNIADRSHTEMQNLMIALHNISYC